MTDSLLRDLILSDEGPSINERYEIRLVPGTLVPPSLVGVHVVVLEMLTSRELSSRGFHPDAHCRVHIVPEDRHRYSVPIVYVPPDWLTDIEHDQCTLVSL